MDPSDDPRPLTAGVMGWPIRHSKSPLIFAHWFDIYGLQGRYCHLAVEAKDVRDVLKTLPRAGFRGVNVTVPHKVDVLEIADQVTDLAAGIGAANLIRYTPNGEIVADNTDCFGFLENLKSGHTGWSAASGPALVLGAGGAARAIVAGLLREGCPELRITNRTRGRAEEIAESFAGPITVVDWDEREGALADVQTLVNSTSLGMTGQHPLALRLDDLPRTALVTDIVYAPLMTPLLVTARARGNPVVDGLGMLLHQARPAFRAWFGVDPEVDMALRDLCLA